MRVVESIVELIGQTPMVRLHHLVEPEMADVLLKLEFFNPGNSVKDRIALSMIETAEEEGKLKPGMTIIEPTSGNTGIGLAMVAAAKGYKAVLVMPETMSVERRKLFKAYGADLVLTPGSEGMAGAVRKAEELLKSDPAFFMPQQFENPANPAVHRKTTAQEILKQTEGKIAGFVAGVGTGGTLTGVGEILKQQDKNIVVWAVEPADSPILSGGQPGPHKIQGIGANFIPGILNTSVYDRVYPVTSEDAFQTARRLAREEGILVGISAGAAVFGALNLARQLGAGKQVVVIVPDNGERYLSTPLFEES
ncbi:cysteine synthase A [Rubeoparvulum massiliense]|uniref:cysteine synthase A n=1 Tax=Rubeoparvulum massiliense TaxID=1631346 RepID=UPI00065E454C|nr:cysteine synthase A [Rubeoparvulum massiliense]